MLAIVQRWRIYHKAREWVTLFNVKVRCNSKVSLYSLFFFSSHNFELKFG